MDRPLPSNSEAEQALLGAILIRNDSCDRVSFLAAHHFNDELHGRIFTTATKLIYAGKTANAVTLKAFFENEPQIGELAIDQYLKHLEENASTTLEIEPYAQTIRELAIRRQLITIGESMVRDAFNATVELNPQDQIVVAETQLYELAETDKYGAGFLELSHSVDRAMNMAALAFGRDTMLSGVATGYTELDQMLGGLQPSDLIVVAGRPSMGKTSLATNIAYNVACSGTPVGFFSLEMSAEQLATRIIAEQSQIPSLDIRSGSFTTHDWDRMQGVAEKLKDVPLHIDECGLLNMAQLSARARKLKRQQSIGLIVVDYLQLVAGSATRSREGRVQEVTEISSQLKFLAKELRVPVLALSQLSRAVEAREDKRPQLSDLRESGAIEQDADVVIFIYREEYYLERRKAPVPDEKRGLAELMISKQRHGPTGTIELIFVPTFTSFRNKT